MRNWDLEVQTLIDAYAAPGADFEALHGQEDDLVEAYVRERASFPHRDLNAIALVRLLDTERTRWYA